MILESFTMQFCNMLLWLVNWNWFESVVMFDIIVAVVIVVWMVLLLLSSLQRHHLHHCGKTCSTRSLFHSHWTIPLSRRHEFVSPITLIRFEMVLSMYIQLSYVSIFALFGLRITNKIKFSTNSSTDVQHQKSLLLSATVSSPVFSTLSCWSVCVFASYSTNCVKWLDFICVTRFYSSVNIKKYVR